MPENKHQSREVAGETQTLFLLLSDVSFDQCVSLQVSLGNISRACLPGAVHGKEDRGMEWCRMQMGEKHITMEYKKENEFNERK